MPQKSIAFSIAGSPRFQAIAGGALALIPGRKYPAWLRHTTTWGSAAMVVAVILTPGLGSKVLERTSGQETADIAEISLRAKAGFATVAGALTYATMRFGWWLDEAAEQMMRKAHVPFPRVVLGIAIGLLYYYTDDRGKNKTVA